ncbi:MAG: polysaccharide pyruvyl transferase family protein [Lachnospiraceae bacterium]|jgi:polysaccharide pyruvyl transferase WcaK-like protein|nr:polysaccharide pyruvyl transferase family protein [Lachnospiraceae bacterium]
MRFSILSGAYKNAGDFLIVKRCTELLKYVYPDCTIESYERRNDLTSYLPMINESNCLILAGGPAYRANIYPQVIPLVDDLSQIKVPIFAMAMGCKNWQKTDRFNESTMNLWKRIEADGFSLGCRDWRSVAVLNHEGIAKTIMTGCAAWYNVPLLTTKSLTKKISSRSEIRSICVSDAAETKNHEQSLLLIRYLRRIFPEAKINFVFHRGISADKNTPVKDGTALQLLIKELEQMKLEYVDISYGVEGFQIYDQCDLHIGFRVHAHIYNLSCGNCSILIEEDQRGTGVNEALGFMSIKAYHATESLHSKALTYILDKHGTNKIDVIKKVEECLNYLSETGFTPYDWVFERIEYYFKQMIKHIQSIRS